MIDFVRVPLRHDEPCPALHGEGSARAAAECGRTGWLEPLDGDAAGLQGVGDSHQRASGADALGKRGHSAVALLPDLSAERVAVAGDDVRVGELVGRVVARLAGELLGAGDHVWMSCEVTRGGPSSDGTTSTSAPSARRSWKRSSVKQSAITISARYPLALQTSASEGPVLPPVYSTTVSPRESKPSRSAPSIIVRAMRSFIEPVGL